VRNARKHLAWYSKSLPSAAAFRAEINRVHDPDAVRAHIRRFFSGAMERLAA
jgi:tRNA-dihydrouridine synthase B